MTAPGGGAPKPPENVAGLHFRGRPGGLPRGILGHFAASTGAAKMPM